MPEKKAKWLIYRAKLSINSDLILQVEYLAVGYRRVCSCSFVFLKSDQITAVANEIKD